MLRKKILSIIMIICLFCINSLTVLAAEQEDVSAPQSEGKMVVTNQRTGEKAVLPAKCIEERVLEQRSANGSKIVEKGYEVTALFDKDNNLITTASDESQTTTSEKYGWKAKVYIAYEDDGSKIRFYFTSGSWTNVGSTSYKISNRNCTYGYQFGIWSKTVDKDLTGNFTFTTGFDAFKYGTGSFFGCNSRATISNGYTLETICNVNL